MRSLKFSAFYKGKFADDGYELYIVMEKYMEKVTSGK